MTLTKLPQVQIKTHNGETQLLVDGHDMSHVVSSIDVFVSATEPNEIHLWIPAELECTIPAELRIFINNSKENVDDEQERK